MPNRYIRESVLDSDKYHGVGLLERLAFFELLLNADDWGLVPVHRVFLDRKTTVFSGLSAEAIGAKLLTLDQADLIRCYTVRGSTFAFIPKNGFFIRSKRPKYPLPDFTEPQNRTRFNELAEICDARALHQISTSTSTITTSTTPASQVIAIPPCPIRKIIATYNETCRSCRQCRVPTATLHGHISARWRQLFTDDAATDFEAAGKFFAEFFARVQASRFLTGRAKARDGGKPFRASLRWLMKPENFAKTIEGEYDDELQRQV